MTAVTAMGHAHPSQSPDLARAIGLGAPRLAAYHRSSRGMRLMRDFSSSAASRESSVGGRRGPGRAAHLRGQDLGATWLNWVPELCSELLKVPRWEN